MIYGLYLSATGILTNSYRQDVIANNLANAETVGFKKDLALFQQRRTQAREEGAVPWRSNQLLEALGGGTLCAPTAVDNTQGDLEHTGNPLDLAVVGPGYFQVDKGGRRNLTRDGRLTINRQSRLALANDPSAEVLDGAGRPIAVDARFPVVVGDDGTINQNARAVARLGIFDVSDPNQLTKAGGTMLATPETQTLRPAGPGTVVRAQFVERANVDPATELSALMDAQRQLEANANMIRYQDQMLSKLVNEVGKIS